MAYRRCGLSGLKLPRICLGLWHNFGGDDSFEVARKIVRRGFDLGITHFDLANNYGPPPGSAELTWGRLMATDLRPYRDELIISTKAGYDMWPGPYGNFGSRKYLLASLDQSLKRLNVDYVDIFYHHRPDPDTPIAETMGALDQIVRSGKALYVGLSNYSAEQTEAALEELTRLGTPCLVHQPAYSMFRREPEAALFETLETKGIGCIVFSPLAQGLLTERYLQGIPQDSRVAKPSPFLTRERLDEQTLSKLQELNALAAARGQSLAQMSLAWVLRWPAVTAALVGASRASQVEDSVGALDNLDFSEQELGEIDSILSS